MRGEVLPDHMPISNFTLLVVGLPPMYFSKIAGLEQELQTVDLPDRTTASGGNTTPVEFTAETMMHHTNDQLALELWFKEGQDPVSPLYKKAATLIHKSLSGGNFRSFTLVALYVSKRKTPDLDKINEGEPAVIEWTFKADDMLPI